MTGIYKIENHSGSVYIGQSVEIERRWYIHRLNRNNKLRIEKSIRSYGPENHIFSVIHELPNDVDKNILDEYEKFYIKQFKECGIVLMNLSDGGSGARHTKETYMIISEKNKNQVISDKHRKAVADANRKRIVSDETRKKMSAAGKGKIVTAETRAKLSAKHKGKKLSPEHIEKMRIARTGIKLKPISEKHRMAIVESNKRRAGGKRKTDGEDDL